VAVRGDKLLLMRERRGSGVVPFQLSIPPSLPSSLPSSLSFPIPFVPALIFSSFFPVEDDVGGGEFRLIVMEGREWGREKAPERGREGEAESGRGKEKDHDNARP